MTSELWDGGEARLLRNVTRKLPRFDLDNLQSGKRLIIKIYSANKKGKQSDQGRQGRGLTGPSKVIKLPSLTGSLKGAGRGEILSSAEAKTLQISPTFPKVVCCIDFKLLYSQDGVLLLVW